MACAGRPGPVAGPILSDYVGSAIVGDPLLPPRPFSDAAIEAAEKFL